jgi:hypothetical protein
MVPAAALAQDAPVQVGVKVGVNVSNVKVDFDGDEVTGDNRTGFLAGLFVARDFNPRAGVQIEALFSQRGTDFGVDDVGFDAESTFKLTYVDIPVLARINVVSTDRAAFRVLVGPSFGFKASQTIEVGGVEIDDDDVELKSFDMGLSFGAAVEVRNFVIDGRYILGLTDINGSDDEGEPTVKNNGYSFSIGWRFR